MRDIEFRPIESSSTNAREQSFFGEELVVVNIGILPFYQDLKALGVRVAHVDWRPPAGGDQEMADLLDKLLS